MAFTKATFDYLDSGGLINWITTAKTSAFTAVSGEGYLVDTTSAAVTVTLPTSPSAGDEIIIVDYASNAGTNNITLDPGTLNLRGATDDFVMSNNNQSARLLYSGATKGWLITSDAGAGAAATPALTVDYLVIAGGGSGGVNEGAGGGAGGLRTSYGTSGGNSSAETALSLSTDTNYTVTIGAGGAAQTTNQSAGNNGSNSIFSSITSTGGGGGGCWQNVSGNSGGSGGGGGAHIGSGGAAVTPTQGYAGGNGGSSGSTYAGAGGGGAGAVGGNSNNTDCGDGGDGLGVSIIGSTVYYAGGGGGSSTVTSLNQGSGGTGGGGNGGNNTTGTITSGTSNTGGGGGGSGNGSNGATSGAGGSGVVILRYPDYYDITVGSGLTTSTTNQTVGSNEKYTIITAGTGNVSFTTA